MTKEQLKKTVGENIRRERLARDLTIERLSELLELSPMFVGLIERGKRGATPHNLLRLSGLFGISVEKFFPEPTPKDSPANAPSEDALREVSELIHGLNENELEFLTFTLKALFDMREDDELPELLESV